MNPFHYGTVVKEPYFFDRQAEKERIIRTLIAGNNLVLYSPRRYGKTSLVMKVIDELTSMDYTCIYFDFMTIYSRESFIEGYTKNIYNRLKNPQKLINTVVQYIKGIRPVLTFDSIGNPRLSIEFLEPKISDKTLEEVIDLPAKLVDNKKLIIIMDEFQDIYKLNGENFERLLRSKIQHQTDVNYLFMGSRTHILQDMFNNRNRPFYNSAFSMILGPLPKAETIRFLIGRFAASDIKIDEETASHLISQAGNIPYYIQFLASEIWQYCILQSKIVTPDIVNLCAERIIDLKGDYYFELFDRVTAYQKKLLKTLAIDNQNVFSADYANRFHLSAASSTQKALNGLIKMGIIEKHENYYLFDDPFFKQYLLRLQA